MTKDEKELEKEKSYLILYGGFEKGETKFVDKKNIIEVRESLTEEWKKFYQKRFETVR